VFSPCRQGCGCGFGGGLSKNLSGACARTTAISSAQFCQDCQRRQSQASIEPVWLTLCFLVKDISVSFSKLTVCMRTDQNSGIEQRGYYTIGIGFVYSLSVIVTVRHRQHRATRRP